VTITLETTTLQTVLTQDAVRFEGETLDIADLVLLGLITGTWQSFQAALRRRMCLAADAAAKPSAEQVHAQATKFRYAHGLLSAAEFSSWLHERSLTLADLSGVLSRELLQEQAAGAERPCEEELDLRGVPRAEALCGGVLGPLAQDAIARLSARHMLEDDTPPDPSDARVQHALSEALASTASGLAQLGEAELRKRLCRLTALEDALNRASRALAGPDELARVLSEHKLDWLRLTGEQLSVRSEGAAREARMLLCEERLAIAEVAERCASTPRTVTFYLEQAPPELAAALLASVPGEVLGPWRALEQWHVLVLAEKVTPSESDPVLHERAAEEILADTLKRHGAGRSELLSAL